MKLRYLSLAISLSTLACGGDEPTTSSSLGVGTTPSVVGATPGLDAGAPQGNGPVATPPNGTPGGTGAPAAGNGGSDMVCEVKTVDSGRVTPDMLIVLDRSGSMRMNDVNRWDPSVSALKTITASLGSTINFGLMTFPGSGNAAPQPAPMQDCSAITDILQQLACIAMQAGGAIPGLDTCGPGTVDVPIAANNGMAIATALDRMAPNGATPTAATLKAAHNSLGSGLSAVDDVARPKYVLLVTDGAPNCSTASSTGGGGGRGFDTQAVEQSVAEIDAMAKDGIKTYVIGYGTKSDAQLSAALDRMAQAGATGDAQHRAIEDGMTLQTEFQKIAGAAASCEYQLNTQPANPSYVEVKLDGMQLNLNDPNGWVISQDRRRITLQGSSCALLSSADKQHVLSVRVLCNPLILE